MPGAYTRSDRERLCPRSDRVSPRSSRSGHNRRSVGGCYRFVRAPRWSPQIAPGGLCRGSKRAQSRPAKPHEAPRRFSRVATPSGQGLSGKLLKAAIPPGARLPGITPRNLLKPRRPGLFWGRPWQCSTEPIAEQRLIGSFAVRNCTLALRSLLACGLLYACNHAYLRTNCLCRHGLGAACTINQQR